MSAEPATPGSSRLARAARALLLLYPRAWRQRYRSEVTELLAQHHVSPRTLLNLLFGAIDARLHPDLFPSRELTVTHQIRAGQFVVSCAAALYATSPRRQPSPHDQTGAAPDCLPRLAARIRASRRPAGRRTASEGWQIPPGQLRAFVAAVGPGTAKR